MTRFDPATLEILWHRLIATADEMATVLVRTSFSTVISAANDFACELMDADGRSLLPLVGGARDPSGPGYEMETFHPAFAYGWSPLRALVAGPLKYVDAPRPELYELPSDPRETVEMLARVDDLNRDRQPGRPELRIGIGIHTGPLTAGTVGSRDRLEYSVIGATVNLASRLEGLCKELKASIVLSPSTQQHVQWAFDTVPLAETAVRGFDGALQVHTLRAHRPTEAGPAEGLVHSAHGAEPPDGTA